MCAHQNLFVDLGADSPDSVWAQCFGHKQAEIFAIIEKAVGRVAPPELRAELWPRTKGAIRRRAEADARNRRIP